MAFDIKQLDRIGPGRYRYVSDEDSATVVAANYFIDAVELLRVGDVIDGLYVTFESDGQTIATVISIYRMIVSTVTPRGSGGAVATVSVTQDGVTASPVDVRLFGVVGDGVTDDTARLAVAFTSGGELFVPEGDYLIAGAGADAGGVSVSITKNTRIRCHPNARFFTDSLDNDLVRFTVPSNGAGLPADGITFEWRGGIFDQRDQKNSTVIPFIGDYPPANAGASATCDGLSIRGDYSDGGTEYSGIRRAHVEDVTFIAGDHWESAGGDSGVFVGGCALQSVIRCRAVGSRDLGVYMSGAPVGTLDCHTVVRDCLFVNCFFGASIKRSSGDAEMLNNTAINCTRGFLMSHVIGSGFNRVRIAGNTGRNCGIPIQVDETFGYSVTDNHFTTLGALLDNGSTVEPLSGCNGLNLRGCKYGVCSDNSFRGIQAGVGAAYPTGYMIFSIETYSVTGTTSNHNLMRSNFGDGLRTAGADTGSNNSYVENYVLNAVTSANVSLTGTNYHEVRVNPTTGMRGYSVPVGFSDGSLGAPSIARRDGVSTGIRFAANFVGLTVSGADSISVDNNSTAGNTRMLVYDVDNGQSERVSVGAPDSGGAGFKVLRIPN